MADPRALLAALLLALLPGASPPRPGELRGQAELQLDLARSALEAGRAEEAHAAARLGLEHAPDDPLLLDLASAAAEAAGEQDEALWLACLGRERAAQAESPDAALLERLDARLARLDPTEARALTREDPYYAGLLELARSAERRKLWLNAVDLYTRCEGTSVEGKARQQLDKLYANRRAVDALLASGADVPLRAKRKRSAEWIAREDAKHEAWEDAYEVKGDNYTVVTNLGYELAHSMSLAMEQMNGFYRRVFRHKERGGNTARCTIRVYATRAEFDRHEPGNAPGVKGFFVPDVNLVATYDPRTDVPPRSLDALWATLFHEASHQFTRLISTGRIPAWLNEGTASYFEGARLLPNGVVETNLVPEGRLSALLAMLDAGAKGRTRAADGAAPPTLREVVSYFEPGSYPGSYYPSGWGLVYFLHNYEDERAGRVYLPIYQRYLESYSSGGKHDPFARFVEHFVEQADVEGVATFAQFESHWRAWIEALAKLHYGGPAAADVLIERGRKQMRHGKHAAARESFRWALRKRPGEPAAWLELGRAHEELDEEDAALYAYRRACEALRGLPDPGARLDAFGGERAGAVLETCLARIRKLDRLLAEGLGQADAAFAQRAAAGARTYAEAGLPRGALLVAWRALEALGGARELALLQQEVRATTGVDLARWRRLPVDPDLTLWDAGDAWTAEGDVVVGKSDGSRFALWAGEDLPTDLRLEVLLAPGRVEAASHCGIVFSTSGAEGLHLVTLDPRGVLQAERFSGEEGFVPYAQLGRVEPGEQLLLAVERTHGEARFLVDGEQVAVQELPPHALGGGVGFWVQTMRASFGAPRVRY